MAFVFVGRIGLTAGGAALAWLARRQFLDQGRESTPASPLLVAVNLTADRTLTVGELIVLCDANGAPAVLQRINDAWELRAIGETPDAVLEAGLPAGALFVVECCKAHVYLRNLEARVSFRLPAAGSSVPIGTCGPPSALTESGNDAAILGTLQHDETGLTLVSVRAVPVQRGATPIKEARSAQKSDARDMAAEDAPVELVKAVWPSKACTDRETSDDQVTDDSKRRTEREETRPQHALDKEQCNPEAGEVPDAVNVLARVVKLRFLSLATTLSGALV